ncbi:hypothetical protein [Deinococcus yavapaiensis]|uniref:Uncharacterized protein n=1 Tax=Deinococcus yavapaiensis KR-236 TaxID=694435 RepID=A0A318SEP1_9DEIO|nr:hypothetical protein [Deinococcus yavapaiensis]PYE55695.1 hypothetical protein DES52_10258 [Deinococcus yavapaiensis KR-236]
MTKARHLWTLALLTAPLAQAQGVDAFARQYPDITSALSSALADQRSDPKRSLADIDRARALFANVAPTLGTSPLAGGIRDALQNARIAIARSPVDLEAQTTQVRGLLRKALHDESLEALGRAETSGVVGVGVLADDVGMKGAARARVVSAARANDVDRVRLLFERVALNKIRSSLDAVNPASRAAAYLETARATSWFSLVQDSPRAGDLNSRDFVAALQSLTAGDTAAFTRQLSDLRASVARFTQAAQRSNTAQPVTVPAQPSTEPAASPPSTAPAATTPAAPTAPATPTAPAASPSSVDALFAPLGLALTASGHGDLSGAREQITEAFRVLNALPANVRSTPEATALAQDLERFSASAPIRVNDVRALLGSASNLQRAATNAAPSALDATSSGVARVWTGWLSGLVFIVLALLAFYPLYLLNLAFGGRNPYWRAIGAALTLLLLPAMLEGVASIGSLLHGLTGAGFFGFLTNLSLFQHPLGQFVWALSLAFAIGLSTWGLRGICMQFGLLARRGPAEPARAQAAVEWDEEL